MDKLKSLKQYMIGLESVVVCYSGGVDSTLLAYVAKETLGEKAFSLFFESDFIPKDDVSFAKSTADELGLNLTTKKVNILSVEALLNNPEDRCYICKQEIMRNAVAVAEQLGARYIAEGSHADDMKQHRPGKRAILEYGALSPFAECGFNKQDIREVSKVLGLKTWNRPSYSCLATRLPHNSPVTVEILSKVERAEKYLRQLGLIDFRLRHRGQYASIEFRDVVSYEMYQQNKKEINNYIILLGYDRLIENEENISI